MPHLERTGLMTMGSKQANEAQTGEDLSNSATSGAERYGLIHVRVGAIRPAHPHRHP